MGFAFDGTTRNFDRRLRDVEGEVFGPDASAYRLGARLSEMATNVKRPPFNARGDGSDATAAIVAAVAAVSADGGGTVLIPGGLFTTSASIVIPDNVHVVGVGNTRTKIQHNGTGPAFTVGTRSSIRDIWIRGDLTAGSVGVNNTANASHWQLERVRVTNCDVGVDFLRTWIVALNDCVVTFNSVANLRFGSPDVNIVTVRGGELQGSASGAGALVGGTNQVVFHGVTIEGNAYGIRITGAPNGTTVRDCYFEINTAGHIVSDAGQTPRTTRIIGNSFFNASGTKADYSVWMKGGVEWFIEGNHFNEQNNISAIRGEAAVDRVRLGANYYLPGEAFDATADYAGTNLTSTGETVRGSAFALTNGAQWLSGSATPEGTAAAPPGSLYTRTNGASTPLAYLKESGTGNTGWRQLSTTVSATVTVDFPAIAANSAAFSDQTCNGSLVGDAVALGASGPLPAGVVFTAVVVADNGVRIYAHNVSTGPVDPASFTFKVRIIR